MSTHLSQAIKKLRSCDRTDGMLFLCEEEMDIILKHLAEVEKELESYKRHPKKRQFWSPVDGRLHEIAEL